MRWASLRFTISMDEAPVARRAWPALGLGIHISEDALDNWKAASSLVVRARTANPNGYIHLTVTYCYFLRMIDAVCHRFYRA